MDGYIRAVSGQLLGKHVPAATRRAVFSMWSVPRCYKQWTRLELSEFCTGVCEENLSGEAEKSPLLEAVARERLVKTAGRKRLSGCCELWRLAMAL
jgi:hypothetical protein